MLQPSRRGRWAGRLSVAATGRLTARLARRRPDALFTDQPQAGTPSDRIMVNISGLDVTAEGTATLEADRQVVPRDPSRPARRDRANVSAAGPVATDRDVVALIGGRAGPACRADRRCGPAVKRRCFKRLRLACELASGLEAVPAGATIVSGRTA